MYESEITVIGLGEIGMQTFLAMNKVSPALGVDINKKILDELFVKGFKVSLMPPRSRYYVICVYTTEQVLSVIDQLDLTEKSLVVIESTILPGTSDKILAKYPDLDLVLFPHRFNPNDPEHHVFNLNRIMGASSPKALRRGLEFYTWFMHRHMIHDTSLAVAEICKPLENAYRFLEITIAQEIKELCVQKGLDFEQVRQAMNTKWNIDVKEARDGVGGKCLPKDIELIDKYIGQNNIFSIARSLNDLYIRYYRGKEK